MSNCETFSLPELILEPHQVREVLRCVLHTIVFCRSLGNTTPREVDSELFDVTYATCGDPHAESFIEQKITEFCKWMDRNPGQTAQLCVAFYEIRKKQGLWLGRSDEKMVWEQWYVTVKISGSGQQQNRGSDASSFLGGASMNANFSAEERESRLQRMVEDCVGFIVKSVNEKNEHLPGVSSNSTVPFPFDIWIASDGKLALGFGIMKRVLMQTSPPPMLG